MDLEQNRQGASTSEWSVTRVIDHMPQLSKLQDTDDIEHFLTTFERLAEVYKCTMEDWAIHLVPLLTGKARAAFVAMSPTYTSDYERVKEAILQKYEINAETYEIEMPSRQHPFQTFHINMLKQWHERPSQPNPKQQAVKDLLVRVVEKEDETEEQYLPVHQSGCNIDLQHLTAEQRRQILECIPEQLFLDTPGRTNLVQHHIHLKDSKPIRQPIYRVPERLLQVMKQELELMQELEVIEPSFSEWNNPIVLIPKKDGSLRFCLDFRKLNSVSKFDPYPMPRVDELVEKLGKAKFLTTLDLCKGYWQVHLSPDSKEFTAFKTQFGHFHFRVLPFGLHGAPATFQRMIDHILRGTEAFAAAYLDDIIIFSTSWQEHLQHLQEVLGRIKSAGLSQCSTETYTYTHTVLL